MSGGWLDMARCVWLLGLPCLMWSVVSTITRTTCPVTCHCLNDTFNCTSKDSMFFWQEVDREYFIFSTNHSDAQVVGTHNILTFYSTNGDLQQFDIRSSTLQVIDLSFNAITSTSLLSSRLHASSLEVLSLAHNALQWLTLSVLKNATSLKTLDLRHNQIVNITGLYPPPDLILNQLLVDYNNIPLLSTLALLPASNVSACENPIKSATLELNFSALVALTLCRNQMPAIPANAFQRAPNLCSLSITHQDLLVYVEDGSFSASVHLFFLNLSFNPRLEYIHRNSFTGLPALETLDLSHNALRHLHHETFKVSDQLKSVHLTGNPWGCLCSIDDNWFNLVRNLTLDDPQCIAMDGSRRLLALMDNCQNYSGDTVNNSKAHTSVVYFPIGAPATLNCGSHQILGHNVTWTTPHGVSHTFVPTVTAFEQWGHDHTFHHWHNSSSYFGNVKESHSHMYILPNGSLYIDYITRSDSGLYRCIADSSVHFNFTWRVHLRLNYDIIFRVVVQCVIIAFSTAGVCLLIGVAGCLSNHIAYKCSPEEEAKRRSIWEVLQDINQYRTTQIGRLQAYSSAKIGQIYAYKRSKVDSFRSHKTDTLASVLVYMQSMREQYSLQVNRISSKYTQKRNRLQDHYIDQIERLKGYRIHKLGRIKDFSVDKVEKLRDYKEDRIEKLKDYKTDTMDKLRESYNIQMQKVRDYRNQQIAKLREQYKIQQQHLLKLLELLDIGHCFPVIEAECAESEQMIFSQDNTQTPFNLLSNFDELDNFASATVDLQGDCSSDDSSYMYRPEFLARDTLGCSDTDSNNSVYITVPSSTTSSPAVTRTTQVELTIHTPSTTCTTEQVELTAHPELILEPRKLQEKLHECKM